MIRARRIPSKFTFDESSKPTFADKTKKKQEPSWKLAMLLSFTFIGSMIFYHTLYVSFLTPPPPPPPPPPKQNEELSKTTNQETKIDNLGIKRSNIVENLPTYNVLQEQIYKEFYNRYGGKTNAMKLYSDTIYTFNQNTKDDKENSIKVTSLRILQSLLEDGDFHLSFGGYSITVGRGNYFYQSYPFVLQRIVRPIFQAIGINFTVRNAAIGGTPSFPYGWCLKNFFGSSKINVVSWDFSMNEGNSAAGLEAYVRHAIGIFNNPMIITLEKDPYSERNSGTKTRRELLNKYIKDGALGADVIILDHAFNIDKSLFDMKPLGLTNWTLFGAPDGAPGKGKWHPTYRKHELLGWVLAIYFMESLEYAINIYLNDDYSDTDITKLVSKLKNTKLPPPITAKNIQDSALSSLYGYPSQTNPSHYKMNHLSCYTSYKPILKNNLIDIIKSSTTTNPDLLTEMNQDSYTNSKQWMYDIGKLERDTKRKLVKFNQLGYIDLKTAYYGIPQSDALKLSIPLTLKDDLDDPTKADYNFIKRIINEKDYQARKYIKSLILCQVNEKRTEQECNMQTNLDVKVGNAKSEITTITFPGALYLNKPICIAVEISNEAEISVSRLPKERNQMMELDVDIRVVGDTVSYDNGACSISHVIMELNDSNFT